ncbi:circadian clock KaiB family protein [Iodidimonas sp. SYSU 1G8]|uniref:circadian clock KaiB family protein n=1 Tax=Iodidimonas sp. SYSU 1G8 TaxID=3133967 RepID=UPI0031FF0491
MVTEQDKQGTSTGLPVALSLYIAGGANPSEAARENLAAALRELMIDDSSLEIVDVLLRPDRALSDHIYVTPTLIRVEAGARKILIGDLRDVAVLKRFISGP